MPLHYDKQNTKLYPSNLRFNTTESYYHLHITCNKTGDLFQQLDMSYIVISAARYELYSAVSAVRYELYCDERAAKIPLGMEEAAASSYSSISNTKTFLTFCRNMVIKTERNIVWNDLKYVLAWKRRRSQELHFQHKNLSHILLSAVFGRLHKQAKFPLFQRKTFHT